MMEESEKYVLFRVFLFIANNVSIKSLTACHGTKAGSKKSRVGV